MTVPGQIRHVRHLFKVSCLAVGFSSGLCLSQPPSGVHNATVRLEPHEGQTAFKIGDPVIVDLVFTSRSPGAVVKTDNNPVRPLSDGIDVSPDGDGFARMTLFVANQLTEILSLVCPATRSACQSC